MMLNTIRVALTLCAVPLLATAQSAPAPAPAPTTAFRATGAFFALSVSDAQQSADWYARAFGLRQTMDQRHGETRVVVLQGGGLTVELVQQAGASPASASGPGGRGALYTHGIFKVGFVVENFDATVATLRERGVRIAHGPFPASEHSPANVIILDNASNYIQILAR